MFLTSLLVENAVFSAKRLLNSELPTNCPYVTGRKKKRGFAISEGENCQLSLGAPPSVHRARPNLVAPLPFRREQQRVWDHR